MTEKENINKQNGIFDILVTRIKRFPRLLKTLNILQWIIIPLLIFWGVEHLLRQNVEDQPQWFQNAEMYAPKVKVDYVFVGSSRVGAAISYRTFNKVMGEYLGRNNIITFNLAQGYSTIQEHYLGLRNLLEKYPNSFKDFTVFIEAPGEVPNPFYYATWKDQWVFEEEPQLLTPQLRESDIPMFLDSYTENVNDKFLVLMKYYFKRAYMLRFRERVKESIDNENKNFLEILLLGLFRIVPPGMDSATQIANAAGIKTDPKALQRGWVSAMKYTRKLLDEQFLFSDWENTVLWEYMKMIQSHGGKVLFFYMPVTSYHALSFQTEIHEKNKIIFKKFLKTHNSEILYPDFSFDDNDFPDMWHLRISRYVEFTEKLGKVYIEYLKKNEELAKTSKMKNGK